MTRLIIFVLGLLLLPSAVFAYEGTIEPPELVEGQYVYTVPDGFVPGFGIGTGGLEEMQTHAAGLHYPFYVVVMEKLPTLTADQKADAHKREYSYPDEEQRAAYTVDLLAEDWSAAYPDLYDTGTSTIFILSLEPRQFRLLFGSRWKGELGLEKAKAEPYAQPFIQAVTGTPKDPKRGIIGVMDKVDEYVFDQTDPERIAERARIQKEREAAHRQRKARDSLDEQIARMGELLEEDPRFLPADVSEYQTQLDQARVIRKADKTEDMALAAADLTRPVSALDAHVKEARTAYWTGQFLWLLFVLFCFAVVLAGGYFLARRLKCYLALKLAYQEASDDWHQKVDNAKRRFVDTFMDREDVVGLGRCTGLTKELRDTVGLDLDNIWTAVLGLGRHVDICDTLAARGNYFNLHPLRQALLDLEDAFDFDTGQVNSAELFGDENRTIRVVPSEFARDQERRFKANVGSWDRLKEAAAMRRKLARTEFSHDTMTLCFERAAEHGIPDAWLGDHPLFGDDTADDTFYDKLNAQRNTDPIAYMLALDEARNHEATIVSRLDALIHTLILVATVRDVTVPDFSGTEFGAENDPAVTLSDAHEADDQLAGLLASEAQNRNRAKVQAQGEHTRRLYSKVESQVAAIQNAIKRSGGAIKTAEDARKADLELMDEANRRLGAARRAHSGAERISETILSGAKKDKAARDTIEAARMDLMAHRHLDALDKAQVALRAAQGAQKLFQTAIASCDRLDAEKAAYERKLSEMESLRSDYARRVRHYNGRSGSVGTFRVPQTGQGLTDYRKLQAELDRQEQEWQRAARKAQRDYEEEQERQRREAERKRRAERRRREEAAAARRRRQSYSSSSSSSSFGGGSSSSGGSFGGGGSSSVGGGW